MTETILIQRRFRGPAGSANGGYTCGVLAGLVDGDTVESTLRRPPPLETALAVVRDGDAVRLLDGDTLVAEARPAELELEPPPPVGFAEATELAAARADDPDHPFPGCFVCGPGRQEGDALRLRPTPVGDGRVVAPWRAGAILGAPPPILAWAALDCPGAYAVNPDFDRGLTVLGRLTARVLTPPQPGDDCVVVGWPLGGEGRRLHAGTALYRDDELLALGRAVWFVVDEDVRDAGGRRSTLPR